MGENNFRACSAAGWRFPSLRGGGWDKKGGSVATSRGMNAKQGDYKCGDRINTLPNTMGITMVSGEKAC